jgi:thioredoxin 1
MLEVTQENFQSLVLESSVPVLLDVWATWCGPCKVMLPKIETLANSRKDILVAKVNADANRELVKSFGISSIPTLIIFSNGKEIARHVGMPQAGLDEFVNRNLA